MYYTVCHSDEVLPEKHTLSLFLETLQSPLKQGETKYYIKGLHQSSHCSLFCSPSYTRGSRCHSELEASARKPMAGLCLCLHEPITSPFVLAGTYSLFFCSDKLFKPEHLVYWLQLTLNPFTSLPLWLLRKTKATTTKKATFFDALRGGPSFSNTFFSTNVFILVSEVQWTSRLSALNRQQFTGRFGQIAYLNIDSEVVKLDLIILVSQSSDNSTFIPLHLPGDMYCFPFKNWSFVEPFVHFKGDKNGVGWLTGGFCVLIDITKSFQENSVMRTLAVHSLYFAPFALTDTTAANTPVVESL